MEVTEGSDEVLAAGRDGHAARGPAVTEAGEGRARERKREGQSSSQRGICQDSCSKVGTDGPAHTKGASAEARNRLKLSPLT